MTEQNLKQQKQRLCPIFDQADFDQQLMIDTVARWGVMIAVATAIMIGSYWESQSNLLMGVLMLVVFGFWMMMNTNGARAWQALGQVPLLIDQNPQLAEERLAQVMRRWPLSRQVRLLLYHRLAMLRHRQMRLGESAAICRAVLEHPLYGVERVEAHLLLLLVESELAQNNLYGAYQGLLQLMNVELNLVESLQHLTLRTRYETAAGYPQWVLYDLRNKIDRVELMPAAQCGVMHAMFALAADRMKQQELSQWLTQRARLLCDQHQLTMVLGNQVTIAATDKPVTA